MQVETYVPFDGLGVIAIRGSETESLLMIKGEPAHFCWCAEIGTVWQYHIGHSNTKRLAAENYVYQMMTEKGELNANTPLSVQFQHILRLLKYSEYELSLTQFPYGYEIPPPSDSAATGYYDVYGSFSILLTQSRLDRSRVDHYRALIRSGKRPMAVLLGLSNSFETFVLDGHHKLQAYSEEKTDPVALRIVNTQCREVDAQAGSKLIRSLLGAQTAYEKIFLEEKAKGYYRHTFYTRYKGTSDVGFFRPYSPFTIQ